MAIILSHIRHQFHKVQKACVADWGEVKKLRHKTCLNIIALHVAVTSEKPHAEQKYKKQGAAVICANTHRPQPI